METKLKELLTRWPDQVRLVGIGRPALILSIKGLGTSAQERLKSDLLTFLTSKSDATLVSVILSLKQGHVYFRLGNETYDYRPHRGAFSRVAVSDHRLPSTDRAEVQLCLTHAEIERLRKYIANIDLDRSQVLGEAHALSLFEPDFTVRSFETRGQLDNNQFLDTNSIHNCLTWLTTAPLGAQGENLITLLGMTAEDVENETHSYIVAFYRFLLTSASIERAPMVIHWTTEAAAQVQNWIEASDDFLANFYSKKSQPAKVTLPSRSA